VKRAKSLGLPQHHPHSQLKARIERAYQSQIIASGYGYSFLSKYHVAEACISCGFIQQVKVI